jgi:hypothetical protein
MVRGSRSSRSASPVRPRCCSVAENSRDWRSLGQWPRMAKTLFGEAHVEHAVGLVQHQMLQVAEVRLAGLQVLQQPARRRDQDVRGCAAAPRPDGRGAHRR